MRLNEIMSGPVVATVPSATAAQAKAAMQGARVRHLVVLGPGRQIVGVVCAHDLHGAAPGSTVEDLMSAPTATLPATADVREAARLLRRRNVGSLPVVEGGRLAGIVTTSDVLALLGKGALRVQATPAKWTLPRRGPTHRPERRPR